MATNAKIKIKDIVELRENLDKIYEDKFQIDLAQWALQLSKHIFLIVEYDYERESVIMDGFATNQKWQSGEARMHDVRQSGFKVHQLAKGSSDAVLKTALHGEPIHPREVATNIWQGESLLMKLIGQSISVDILSQKRQLRSVFRWQWVNYMEIPQAS